MYSPSLSPTLTQAGAPAQPTARAPGPLRRGARGRKEAAESDVFATRLHDDRELRVAASFCEDHDEALWLLRRLRALPQMTGEQVLLLKPMDAAPRRYAQWQAIWDALRPAQRAARGASLTLLTATGMAGLLLGLATGLLAGLSLLATLAVTVVAVLALGAAALTWRRRAALAAPRRRFDQTLQQGLARGQFAVVVTGVHDAATASAAIETMRSVGIYWCAETPRKAA